MIAQREFQKDAKEKLTKGQSVLIVAPTGLGKTRAALEPFVNGNSSDALLSTRLIYNLPLRSLASGVVSEFKELSSKYHPIIHHGDEPESEIFSEKAIITTVDQYFTAFAGAPLSWASHWSHAAAGAILTSYSVFDEVHLLSPKAGLQLLFAVLRLRQRWGLVSCVMTATMPTTVVEFFKEFCKLELVEASEKDIKMRDSWRKVSLQLLSKKSQPQEGKIRRTKKKSSEPKFVWEEKDAKSIAELVQEKWQRWNELGIDGPKKVIVFVNTVDRAIAVYEDLCKSNLCSQICLAHSRFVKEHRKQLEDRIQQFFGKDAQDKEAILVTTQVAEAGLNISAPLVITELCPMDSLIQRAGRCQRFKPECDQLMRGLTLVVQPKDEKGASWRFPYIDFVDVQDNNKGRRRIHIIEVSRYVLEEHFAHGRELDWNVEKNLINEALSDAYRVFLQGLDSVQYNDIKDKPLGKVYKQMQKITPEEGGLEEEYGEEEARSNE